MGFVNISSLRREERRIGMIISHRPIARGRRNLGLWEMRMVGGFASPI